MPVITFSSLDLLEEQKAVLAKKATSLLSELTKVPEERIYVFFSGKPLTDIAAGGVLNSELPASVLKQFATKYTAEMEAASITTVLTRVKARAGKEDEAEGAILSFARQTRQEPGCIGYDIYRGSMDLYRKSEARSFFVFQERWRDQAAINEHLSMPFFAEFMGRHDDLFDGPFEVTSMLSAPKKPWFPESSNQIKVVLHLKAQPKSLEAVRSGALAMADMMRRQPGCLRYDLYQGFEGIYDTSVFMADQVWADQESQTRALQELNANMPFFIEDLAEPRQPIVFQMASDPVGEHRRPAGKPSFKENAVLADEDLQAGLKKLNPDFGQLCIDASAVAWGKPLIDQKTKVLIAIAVDVVEQITGPAFANHVDMAMKQGVTREELEELFLFMTIYAGFNKAGTYYRLLGEIMGPRG